uniref:Phospholipid scramblase n=1 Tax=Astyanax mexicanus TaxID=7994 RepID=A0A8B9KJ98_ASTMX
KDQPHPTGLTVDTRENCSGANPYCIQKNIKPRLIKSRQNSMCTSTLLFPPELSMEVQAPPGNTIGYVVQNWHPFLPKFSLLGPSHETLLTVEGPMCTISCCGDVDFNVSDGSVIGRISKQWAGLIKEGLTDADNFGINFPLDLDVRLKATLLGACFLIDFMFFENVGDSGQRCSVFG